MTSEESDRGSQGFVWPPTKCSPVLPKYYSWAGRDHSEVGRLGYYFGEVGLLLLRSSVVTGSTLRVGRGGDGQGDGRGGDRGGGGGS